MKKLAVILLFLCLAFGAWQQSGEITLPKSIQVNDLTISNSGEIWILSASALLKLEATSKSPLLIQEISDGKVLAAQDEIYILDNTSRLVFLNPSKEEVAQPTRLTFNSPDGIAAINADNDRYVLVLESNQLNFCSKEKILGSIITNADKFTVVPLADYSDTQTPLFTLANNRISSWTGGTFKNIENYRSRLLYSASNTILDFTADENGNLFVLFSDSIVVLGLSGEYKQKISIETMPLGSKILTNPANNNLVLFNRFDKTLEILSNIRADDRGEIVALHKNHPNPVDNLTDFEFTINQPLNLTITIYNLIGEPVKVIAKGHYAKGTHQVTWHADDDKGNLVPNGVYFYRLESEKGVAIRQLIVLR